MIELTVQSTNGGWRLGLSIIDSLNLFNHRELVKIILDEKVTIKCRCSCGTKKKKAFDLNGKCISIWIESRKYNDYLKYHPTKLLFNLKIEKEIKTLTFVGKKQ
jgi:hypothetical protein